MALWVVWGVEVASVSSVIGVRPGALPEELKMDFKWFFVGVAVTLLGVIVGTGNVELNGRVGWLRALEAESGGKMHRHQVVVCVWSVVDLLQDGGRGLLLCWPTKNIAGWAPEHWRARARHCKE